MAVVPFSPAEVFMDIVRRFTDPTIARHVVFGPLSHEQQAEGGVGIMDAGQWREDTSGLLVYPRMQLRCIASTLDLCERLGRHVGFALDAMPGRVVATQVSTGNQYLVHSVTINSGPSAHQDTEQTWEYLVFAHAVIGLTPVATAA